jgi:hypothetical protein
MRTLSLINHASLGVMIRLEKTLHWNLWGCRKLCHTCHIFPYVYLVEIFELLYNVLQLSYFLLD